MYKKLDIFTDGACSGNPGRAAIGAVIKSGDNTIKQIAQDIGDATNNIAEYMAIIFALQEALILKADEISLSTDSELAYKQLTGQYQIKNSNLKPLLSQVHHLLTGFKIWNIKHIPREQNQEADNLAKGVLKKKAGHVGCLPVNSGGEESPSSTG